jgi:hypothetical protein
VLPCDGAEARVAGLPIALGGGDGLPAVTDEVPGHEHRLGKGHAADDEHAGVGGEFQMEAVGAGREAGKGIAVEGLVADTQAAFQGQDAVFEAGVEGQGQPGVAAAADVQPDQGRVEARR